MQKAIEIMFIEDNPFDIVLIQRTIQQHPLGNKVHIFPDGPDALDFLLSKGRYDDNELIALPKLIILDLHLPKVPGLQMLKIFKSHPKIQTIPVIIFSSRSMDEEIDEAHQLGASGYFYKPLDMSEYRKALTDIFDHWLSTNQPMAASV